mmetsp:Transcript_35012/g.79834  ORF Transcript_35012/g.79834 Transcript_35012/m.79834 type:complete len:140 (-) Transcript_35012:122-541(-)
MWQEDENWNSWYFSLTTKCVRYYNRVPLKPKRPRGLRFLADLSSVQELPFIDLQSGQGQCYPFSLHFGQFIWVLRANTAFERSQWIQDIWNAQSSCRSGNMAPVLFPQPSTGGFGVNNLGCAVAQCTVIQEAEENAATG